MRRIKLKRLRYRHIAILFFALLAVTVGVGISAITSKPKPESKAFITQKSTGVTGISLGANITDFNAQDLLTATNAARSSSLLSPLSLSAALNSSAQAKCNDMIAKNYWSHVGPDGTQPWQFIQNAGYKYAKAAENLAYGFSSSKSVVDGWIASPEHKANLLDSTFKDVGFGICESNNFNNVGHVILVVQHFGAPSATGSYSLPVYKPYVPPFCTKTPIPYKTNYVDASYLYVGQTQSYGGTDGYTQTCTADSTGYKPSDITLPPYDKTIYVGTKPTANTAPPPSSPSISYQQAQSNCLALGTGNSSAFDQCMHAYGY